MQEALGLGDAELRELEAELAELNKRGFKGGNEVEEALQQAATRSASTGVLDVVSEHAIPLQGSAGPFGSSGEATSLSEGLKLPPIRSESHGALQRSTNTVEVD